MLCKAISAQKSVTQQSEQVELLYQSTTVFFLIEAVGKLGSRQVGQNDVDSHVTVLETLLLGWESQNAPKMFLEVQIYHHHWRYKYTSGLTAAKSVKMTSALT